VHGNAECGGLFRGNMHFFIVKVSLTETHRCYIGTWTL